VEYTVAVCGTEMRSDMAAVKAGARGRSASLALVNVLIDKFSVRGGCG
jgi:hypothetical protein